MIPEKIRALFDFIDYLGDSKTELIEIYLPLCQELTALDMQRARLNPRGNYLQKRQYDAVQKEISEKFQPIQEHIYLPFLQKLRTLGIWSGDDVYTSIFNNNSAAIFDFHENFEDEDVEEVLSYKRKYISFRTETNSNFLCLQFLLSNLDEILKQLFDFFKDTSENEFAAFEAKVVDIDSLNSLYDQLKTRPQGNVAFKLPQERLIDYQNVRKYYPELYEKPQTIHNKIIMGNNIELGNITGHGNVLNTGNHADIHTTVTIGKGDLQSVKDQMSKYGIETADIEELSQILQSEQPDSTGKALGEKSRSWILKITDKALSGAGKIATGISSNILAHIIRQYYGL